MACPDCGLGAGAGRVTCDSWIARETFAGHVSTFSRPRKLLLATGVAVALSLFISVVALLVGGGDENESAGGPPGNADDLARGVPTRIGPTGPAAPDTTTPTGSADPTRKPGSPGPSRTKPKPPKNPPPARNPSFTSWAGPGCSAGRYEESGRFENGFAAWYTVKFGGHDEDSCDGRFSAVPMSGAPNGDGANSATWSWKVGDGFEECALAVFVPRSDRDLDVAGNPTFYRVLADPDDTDSSYAAFAVRQTVHRGSLVSVGSYEVKRGGQFAVQLLNRGRDWGDEDLVGAHHAAAQMKLACRA